jgi:glycerol uptake facilitator-like aquaporin
MHRHCEKILSEFLGTLALLCTVIGSGIMAEKLAGSNVAVALLANTLATVFALYVLIEVLGPIGGAHFNPVVSAVMVWRKTLPASMLAPYVLAQLAGAVAGAWLANAMFDLPVFQTANKLRGGVGQWMGEIVATACLLLVIFRAPAGKVAPIVACTIGAAYWFTSSTSFANPAAVFGRMFSDSFAGIAPASAAGFVLAQVVGGLLAMLAACGLERDRN